MLDNDNMLDNIAQEIYANGGSAELINAVHACREGHPLNLGLSFENLQFMLAGRNMVTGDQKKWIDDQVRTNKKSLWIRMKN